MIGLYGSLGVPRPIAVIIALGRGEWIRTTDLLVPKQEIKRAAR
jgi:hypothetical protein